MFFKKSKINKKKHDFQNKEHRLATSSEQYWTDFSDMGDWRRGVVVVDHVVEPAEFPAHFGIRVFQLLDLSLEHAKFGAGGGGTFD